MPSLYGASKLDFKKDRDVVVEPDADRHFQTVLKEIIEEREKGRAVLVYFRSTEEMERFTASEYGQRLGEHNKVTEKTDNLPFFVNKATTAGTVTLMPAVFGRGLDFVSRDSAVDAAGGVHVIQTYFSEDLSEEIQTKGRTARQAKKGSFKMILSGKQLVEMLKLTLEQI
jgi:preprotein translocase subunit SecA